MADKLQNILIFQRSKTLPAKLRETLRLQGYTSSTVFDVKSALNALKEWQRGILLVDCGESRQMAQQSIKMLVDTPDICDYPCIIIVTTPDEFKQTLDRYFILARTVESPCGLPQVMEAINHIHAAYPEYLKQLSKVAPEKAAAIPQRSEAEAAPTPGEAVKQAGAAPRTQMRSVPEALFSQLQSLSLLQRSLHGQLYVSRLDENILIEQGCFPKNEKIQHAVRNLCKDFSTVHRQHLYRTAFVNGQSAKALNFAEEMREQGLGASFLLAYAFSENDSQLLTANYLTSSDPGMRKAISTIIKESAYLLSHTDFPEIAAVISTLAALLESGQPPSDDEHSVLASSIMAADLLDRACYQAGYWNPQAANGFLHKIKLGALAGIHPKVLPCIVKILVEAANAKPPVTLTQKSDRNNPILQLAAQNTREQKVRSNERKVDLTNLTPGMKLTRPLMSFDGSEVLGSNLVLDSDLIWRVWQLATVKILNTPLVVDRASGGSK